MSVKLRIVGLYYNNEIDYQSLTKPLVGKDGQAIASIKSLLDAAETSNKDENVEAFSYKRDAGGIQVFSVEFKREFTAPVSGNIRSAGTYKMDDRLDAPGMPDLVWQYYITEADGKSVTFDRTRKQDPQQGELKIKDFPDVEVLEGDSVIFRLVSILNGPSGSNIESARAQRDCSK